MSELQSIGSYDLLKLLATGGMAEIYLARSKTLKGKIVALKRTIPDLIDSPEMSIMFTDEMKVAACLNHQNIVQTFDFGFVESRAYLVMEYIHGVSLRDLLRVLRGKTEFLKIPVILYIVKKVAEGLAYLARVPDPVTGAPLSLIHRDLSPHNIMLTYEGEVKIIDFGIAKGVSTTQTQHGVIKGKFAYMSPEQMRGEDIDQRSDLFSLGVIFWEMLSNSRFFSGNSVNDLYHVVSNYRLENIDCSMWGPLEPVLRRLLHHDAKQRYIYASDLARDLQRLLNQLAPQFSSEEISYLLKVKYFRRDYELSLSEIRRLQTPEPVNIPVFVSTLPEETSGETVTRAAAANDFASTFAFRFKEYISIGLLICLFAIYKYTNKSGYPAPSTIERNASAISEVYFPIAFYTVPSQAKIEVDGKVIGSAGIAFVKMKEKTSYLVKASKPGYATRVFTFSPTKPARYEIHLSKKIAKGDR
ncbi:serine/threonine-protein kinase [Bdellovibrio sp. 22V]|uniref:serine/threonine protein kinase n=1 Tax=Bdellovibrio sp. 22V TaxID=3044166 RepID=UPI002543CFF7|nr:serine/threonine-protein kinase [Bdellovibrio sp. 22V]WII73395.1 serine/threonine-protein kinase [Bdellovibrio sp. 22V]